MKLRIGVVGAGGIARESHLPVLKNLRDVEVAAICDQRLSMATEQASKFGISSIFADMSEMLTKEKLDVVDICTPPQTHAPLAIEAMEAGCNVLVEKPLASSVKDSERMLEVSKRNSVKLCVVHQNLCNSAVLKARRLVESGALGNILNVNVQTFESKESEACLNQNHWCHTLPGGIFGEILPHPIYLLQSFLNGETHVHVLSKKVGDLQWMKKDELRVTIEAENGFGSILASCNSVMHGDTLEIIGTQKALRVDLWGRTVIIYRPHTKSSLSIGLTNLHLGLQMFTVIGSTASTMLKAVRGRASAHYDFISKFIDSIRNGTKPPATAEDGLETVKTLEAICTQI
jgi:predicted dehydrogenase